MEKILRLDTKTGQAILTLDLENRTGSANLISASASLQTSQPIVPGGTQSQVDENPDWYSRPFRLLTATVIEGHWLDISETVLKDALALFEDIPLFVNHNDDVRDWLGNVTGIKFQEAKGKVPGGINGDVNINKIRDQKLGGDIILGVQSGILKRGSIGFWYEWEPSHVFENTSGYVFWEMLGKEVDGSVVRLIIKRITRVAEYSIVSMGADDFATALKKGSAISNNQTSEQKNLEEIKAQKEEQSKQEVNEMKEKLISKLGLPKEATEEQVLAEVVELQRKGKEYDANVASLRKEAQAQLKLLIEAKQKITEGMEELLGTCDEKTLRILIADLDAKVAAVIPSAGHSAKLGEGNGISKSNSLDKELPVLPSDNFGVEKM